MLSKTIHSGSDISSKLRLTPQARDWFKADDYFDEWIGLWPEGVKRNGYYLRSSSCRNKFKRFISCYGYAKERVMAATRQYLEEQAQDGYQYCMQSGYLIEKNRESRLADLCENYTAEDVAQANGQVWLNESFTTYRE